MGSKLAAGIEQQRDGAVVHQFDQHVLLEPTGGDLDPLLLDLGREVPLQGVGRLRFGGLVEARSASLAAVPEQRELADDQHPAADFR